MTRRTLLSFIPGAMFAADGKQAAKSRLLPPARGEFVRFTDSVTENVVVRLTLPTSESLLPSPENRFVSSKEGFLVFTSTRTGMAAPFRANLRTGAVTQIAEVKSLAVRSLALDWREREVLYVDSGALRSVEIQRSRSRTLHEGVSDFHVGGRTNEIVILCENKLLRWNSHEAVQLAENVSSRGIVNPTGNGCAFSRQEAPNENEFWFAPFTGGRPRLLAKGKVSYPYWRPDGQTLLFLRQVERRGYVASELCEVNLDGSPERNIAETSQFASFAPNGDGSVFVGASRSRAQPNIVLMLRTPRREMVLCEHRARSAQTVSPTFSPNSQRVYFQSDHEGQSALYSVNVERLVEQTEES
jgi:oligogalacturonide lyase